MRMMLIVPAAGIVMAAALTAQVRDDTGRTSDSLERPFSSGGRVRMDLSAGEYLVTGTADNSVRVEWNVRDPDDLWRVKARAEVRGGDATIETDGPDHNGLHAVVRVPARTDLDIKLSAGELRIEGVEGHKEVDLYAGEVDIDVRRAADYRSVAASVWAGEIDAPPFSSSTGGLFRSLDWTGTGPYRLRVKLWAGEVRLYTSGSAAKR
jgi:hypothetical protein